MDRRGSPALGMICRKVYSAAQLVCPVKPETHISANIGCYHQAMSEHTSGEPVLFEVETPLGFRVRTTLSYWILITTIKHPAIKGREEEVKTTLTTPDEIRLSQRDETVYLFYRSDGHRRWVCAVTKRLNGVGFLITAYRTGGIKEGKQIWHK
jgi:hypothetical protein